MKHLFIALILTLMVVCITGVYASFPMHTAISDTLSQEDRQQQDRQELQGVLEQLQPLVPS